MYGRSSQIIQLLNPNQCKNIKYSCSQKTPKYCKVITQYGINMVPLGARRLALTTAALGGADGARSSAQARAHFSRPRKPAQAEISGVPPLQMTARKKKPSSLRREGGKRTKKKASSRLQRSNTPYRSNTKPRTSKEEAKQTRPNQHGRFQQNQKYRSWMLSTIRRNTISARNHNQFRDTHSFILRTALRSTFSHLSNTNTAAGDPRQEKHTKPMHAATKTYLVRAYVAQNILC